MRIHAEYVNIVEHKRALVILLLEYVEPMAITERCATHMHVTMLYKMGIWKLLLRLICVTIFIHLHDQ